MTSRILNMWLAEDLFLYKSVACGAYTPCFNLIAVLSYVS